MKTEDSIQGGVLAATFFITYINELKDLTPNAQRYLYADDLVLIYVEDSKNK